MGSATAARLRADDDLDLAFEAARPPYAIPGGETCPESVIQFARELRDYGWNGLIISAVSTGSFGAATAFCAQARAECLDWEKNSSQRPAAEKHFANYMKFWLLENRIERLNYSAKATRGAV